MAFLEDTKINLRRHLGYPVAGNPVISPVGGGTLAQGYIGHRFFEMSGALEHKMNNLTPIEEAMITGDSTGLVRVSAGPDPTKTVPDSILLSVSLLIDGEVAGSVDYTTAETDTIYTIALELANLILQNGDLAGANFYALSPINAGAFAEAAKPPSQVMPFPGIQIARKNAPDSGDGGDFEITVSSSDSAEVALSVAPGSGKFVAPKSIFEDIGEIRGYLPLLDYLEGKILTSSDNMDIDKADVWTARKTELKERLQVYNMLRHRLAVFFNVQVFDAAGRSMGTVGMARGALVA